MNIPYATQFKSVCYGIIEDTICVKNSILIGKYLLIHVY